MGALYVESNGVHVYIVGREVGTHRMHILYIKEDKN